MPFRPILTVLGERTTTVGVTLSTINPTWTALGFNPVLKVKVKVFHYKPEVALGVPGG